MPEVENSNSDQSSERFQPEIGDLGIVEIQHQEMADPTEILKPL
jgi:hypothetical protein